MKKTISLLLFLYVLFGIVNGQYSEYNILSPKRLELTKDYCKKHYGMNTYMLKNPQIIVIHYTVYPTLEEVLNKFKPDELPSNRGDINKYSSLNVSVHFVVDKDGTIYTLLPDTIIGRHLIGYNYTAIGIENVAKNKEDLTTEQIESNAKIISELTLKYPEIKYLIGHHEYMIKTYPHYKLYKENDPNYKPSIKSDPGNKFMKDLREKLKQEHNIELLK